MSASFYSAVEDEVRNLERRGELRSLREVGQRAGATAVLDGARCVNLSSNDYLGLGSDESLLRSFLGEVPPSLLDRFGMAASSARLLTGNHPAYGLLEGELGDLFDGRSVCVFSSGYHANLAVCSAFAGRHDLIFADRLNHASLVDGMRLSGAGWMRYRHGEMDHLESLLRRHRSRCRSALIVTESVFSMDGDVPDLERLVQLRRDYDAVLIVDEAHAVGAVGPRGLGVCAARGLGSEVDFLVGTFGKALASYGAFVVCDARARPCLINRARPFIFTTALPPAVVHWTRRTLERAVGMDRERAHLARLAGNLRAALRAAGANTAGDAHIVPVLLGETRHATDLAERLRAAGFLALAIRPPTVPAGTARLRLSLTANLSWDQIRSLPDSIGGFLAPGSEAPTPNA
jgi:8-amino-7-oxononanoate synthase